MQRKPGENTRAVHLPEAPMPAERAVGLAVWRSTTFEFDDAQSYADVLGDRRQGYSYSRIDNPTVDAFATGLAALEGANLDHEVRGQAFASGMAAITCAFMTHTRQGAHVVASNAVYGGTFGLLSGVLARFGVETDFVDITDLDQVRAAMRPNTAVIYAETLANPTMTVADIPELAEIAHDAGARLFLDSTFASPVVCRPLEHGADLVIHSATKYIGGHSDVTGGVVAGRPEIVDPIRKVRTDTGGSLAPDDAFLLRRGLETLPLRVRRQNATAMVYAATIARHAGVTRVDYPGLTEHPGYEAARRLFDSGPEGTRFGAVVTVTPEGGYAAGMRFADGLGLVKVAASLGGTHTMVSHVASTTHRQMDETQLKAAGIDPGAVRISVGLEDAEDLIADTLQALDRI
jgi:cystathionine beta-lyase/cystathionine gamma-synthase